MKKAKTKVENKPKSKNKAVVGEQTMIIRSTISRLSKVVKGSYEQGSEEKEEEISVSKFLGPVATVGVQQRLTTTFGGDWVQLGVYLSIPCYPEEIEEAFMFGDEWVTRKIQEEVGRVSGKMNQSSGDSEIKIEEVKKGKKGEPEESTFSEKEDDDFEEDGEDTELEKEDEDLGL